MKKLTKRFRKKPVEIEAAQLTDEVADELAEWCGGSVWVDGMLYPESIRRKHIQIPTLEGSMEASPGDWIIRGVAGEFYPCKPDIFERTYEAVS